MMILDGRTRFDCSLSEFYRRPELAQRMAMHGAMMPLPSVVAADAAPALGYVNSLWPYEPTARWLARCPDCPIGEAYVWLDGPLVMLCVFCGNRSIGFKFRPVELPSAWRQIAALLMERPDPKNWHWTPGESLDDIRAGTASLETA